MHIFKCQSRFPDRIEGEKKGYTMTEHASPPTQLTHLDESGNIHMVDVTDRPETTREAIARARVRMEPRTVHLIDTNQDSTGSVLEVAKIAGLMLATSTPP